MVFTNMDPNHQIKSCETYLKEGSHLHSTGGKGEQTSGCVNQTANLQP